MKKKLLSTIIAASMVAGLMTGCGSGSTSTDSTSSSDDTTTENTLSSENTSTTTSTGSDDKFYIYSWNTELQERLNYVYDVYPELKDKIEYVNVGDSGVYQEKIDQLLQAPDAKDYPDMIAFEAGYIMKYTNSDYTLPITDLGLSEDDLTEMYPYTIEIAEDKRDGSIKGLSWQSCPGAFMYRADLAEEYLGVTSPEEMQAKISTWDDFIATAEELKEKSNDATRILSSNGDVSNVFNANKSEPWVDDNGVFHMDDAMIEYMEVLKTLETEDLTRKTNTWTDEWNAGPSTDEVFGYFGCTWFLHWTIKANCGGTEVGEGTYGKWNMCQGPEPYYWGGTWLGATAGCSDKDIAGKIMKVLCCDTDTMKKMSEETLDYVNNKTAMQQLSDEGKGSYDFLGGQDFIAAFLPLAENVDVSWMCAYDTKINDLFGPQLEAYQLGTKDRETAIKDFEASVKETYPDLTFE
jgi:ABC-type glycerol-3-phosphate transport system substrate-binding protein